MHSYTVSLLMKCKGKDAWSRFHRSCCFYVTNRNLTLFVSEQMEADSLVSSREDISSLFPDQTTGPKYEVRLLVLEEFVYCMWPSFPHTK